MRRAYTLSTLALPPNGKAVALQAMTTLTLSDKLPAYPVTDTTETYNWIPNSSQDDIDFVTSTSPVGAGGR